MNKREFLKKSALLTLGGAAVTTLPINAMKPKIIKRGRKQGEEYLLPELEYAFDALEPNIDAMTVEIHHDKHHAAYTKNFNAAIEVTAIAMIAIFAFMLIFFLVIKGIDKVFPDKTQDINPS